MPELSLHVAQPEQITTFRNIYEDSLLQRIMKGTMSAQEMFEQYNPHREIKNLRTLLETEKVKTEKSLHVWLVQTGKRPVGYLAFQENAGDIHILHLYTLPPEPLYNFTQPDDQQPKIGTFLDTKLEEYAREKKIKTISVTSKNWSAGFYQKRGYSLEDVKRQIYRKHLMPE